MQWLFQQLLALETEIKNNQPQNKKIQMSQVITAIFGNTIIVIF